MTADDPWVMYDVVRKDRPLSLGRAMALAGAGAVLCAERFGERFPAAWWERPRKVALRADPEAFAALASALDGVCLEDTLLCLPPRLRSQAEPELAALRPYTDGPRPKEPPAPPDGPALVYVVRPGVLRTAGKAMAQAGHAALECVRVCGEDELRAWKAAGCPGEVREAGEAAWGALKALPGCVAVVRDAGLTQVAPGTETVLALPPRAEQPELVAQLPRIL